jgi:hypothetical protein
MLITQLQSLRASLGTYQSLVEGVAEQGFLGLDLAEEPDPDLCGRVEMSARTVRTPVHRERLGSLGSAFPGLRTASLWP